MKKLILASLSLVLSSCAAYAGPCVRGVPFIQVYDSYQYKKPGEFGSVKIKVVNTDKGDCGHSVYQVVPEVRPKGEAFARFEHDLVVGRPGDQAPALLQFKVSEEAKKGQISLWFFTQGAYPEHNAGKSMSVVDVR